MKMRIVRLLIAFSIVLSSIVSNAYALKDPNPAGYVEDLSSLPGLEIYQQHTTQEYSMSAWIEQHQKLYACGLMAAGFVMMYAFNAEFRKKVHAWLGLRAEGDNGEASAT